MARDQVLPQDGDAVISAPPAVPQSDIPNIDVLKLYEQFPTSGTTGERGSRTTSIPKPEQQNLQTAQTGEPKRPEAYGFPVVSDLVDPAQAQSQHPPG